MKHLFIIRHAKSSWKETGLNDFDRPLNKRGQHDAPMMGERLRRQKIDPDCIVSSPALRAKTTAEKIAKKVGFTHSVLYDEALYEADLQMLLHVIKKIDADCKTAFLIGHNPSLNELATYLTGFEENIPTCGIVHVTFTCKDFKDADAANARLVSFDYPKKEV